MGAVTLSGADEAPVIVGRGTPEAIWQSWPALAALPALDVDELVPPRSRIVVVSPHPDDEVLACGGLLAMLAARGRRILIVGVTDGDASHPGSAEWPPARLAARRFRESTEGLTRLGLTRFDHVRLEVPDGKVACHTRSVTLRLHALLISDDVVLSTWSGDGHPDHQATAEATADACSATGCRHLQMPVWMWHWALPRDPRVPWSRMARVSLDADALRRKRHAIAAHRSQIEPQAGGRPPVLPGHVLRRFQRSDEYLLLPR